MQTIIKVVLIANLPFGTRTIKYGIEECSVLKKQQNSLSYDLSMPPANTMMTDGKIFRKRK